MATLTLPLSAAVLTAALLFGGGARRELLSDLVPQLLSLVLLVYAAPAGWARLRQEPLAAAVVLGLIVLPLLHLIPLPPALWSALPGRGAFLEAYQAAGVAPPWLPLALRPDEAMRSAFALLPALSLFLAALSLDARGRALLVLVDPGRRRRQRPLGHPAIDRRSGSPLYFFAITNSDRAVGFFANANHYAAFLYSCIPLCVALFGARLGGGLVGADDDWRRRLTVSPVWPADVGLAQRAAVWRPGDRRQPRRGWRGIK